MRVGIGFDAHRFANGIPLVVGGVQIPADFGLEGHSDGDVLCHAIADAILGAVGAGDLGAHFAPGDPRWAGAASATFVEYAASVVAGRGGRIVNVDATFIAERPHVAPFTGAMRAAVAGALGIDPAHVGIKATTTDGLGATGRGEGAAAIAVALVDVPSG